MSVSPFDAFPLFIAMLVLTDLGRKFHLHSPQHKASSAIEGAIFGLFGLLLAFTFSGAIGRYDTHRKLVTDEVNDIRDAYDRIDLLPKQQQDQFRQDFRAYVTTRLDRFDAEESEPVSIETTRLQKKIWSETIEATTNNDGSHSDGARLLLPALSQMFDIANTRKNTFDLHPPTVVYLLLFTLSSGCAFFAGYNMTDRNHLHILAFALVISLTVYSTLDIEYPRKGFIRLNSTDQQFTTLRDSM
jgi:hypothetical protein